MSSTLRATATHPRHVVNLSNKQIDQNTLDLLEKGLNFSISPRAIPKEDILCNIEHGIRELPDNIKETIRQDCSIILRKSHSPKSNISKQEHLALKTLNQDPDIVVLKVDRGGAVIIMNTIDYNEKMIDHLTNSGYYIKLNKNPLKKISRNVHNLTRSSKEHKIKNLLENNPYTPRIYVALKIHKEGVPIRPIVNTIGGPTYQLEKYLAKKLKPMVGNTNSFVKDCTHFINEIKDLNLDTNDILVSFDVKSLYTNIPMATPHVCS